MKLTRRTKLAAGVAVAATLALAAWTVQSQTSADASPSSASPVTVPAERRTLEVVDEISGTLAYGEERPISAAMGGTLTQLPENGDRVERGDIVFGVNGQPVILLYGDTPAWRALDGGVKGPDVMQLEKNLIELGYGSGMTVDETWDSDTTEGVKAWQTDAGLDVDGRVDLGEVVFETGPVIVAGSDAARGSPVAPGTPVLRVTGTTRTITATLSASQREGLQAGDSLEVELPDGSRVQAAVEHVDDVPTVGEDGSHTYALRLTLPSAGTDSANGAVTLSLVRHERSDVLAVPVNALVALLESGYAVELLRADGSTDLVAVDVGLFADGWVEVEGDLSAGDKVVVP